MQLIKTPLQGLCVLTPQRYGDDRGFFAETWSARKMADLGFTHEWVQDNHSVSAATGTLRGLHFQSPPYAQNKLVRCGRGALWDVAVDIRRGSPTYGQWYGTELSAENGIQMLVPEGFAHGFVTLEPDTEVIYKCSGFYAPDCEGSVAWDSVGISWPISQNPVLSDKDARAPTLAQLESPFEWSIT